MVKLTAAHSQLFFANYKKKNEKEKQKENETKEVIQRTWGKKIEASMKETKREVKDKQATHKSNPSSIPQGYVDWYSTLGYMGGGNRCGGPTLMRVTTTCAG